MGESDETCPNCGTGLELELEVELDHNARPVMANYWYCSSCDQNYEKYDETYCHSR